MPNPVAFELKADHKDSFSGGSVTLRGGEHFDIAAALKQGNGRIVTDDERVIEPLLSYDALKRVPVEPARPVTTRPTTRGGE